MKHFVEDKVIIVTGGSSGFGFEAAKLLVELNAKVVIVARTAANLEKAEKEINSPNLISVAADVTQLEDWQTIIEKTIEKFGTIDVLINNAGGGISIKKLDEMPYEDIHKSIDLNLMSAIYGSKEVAEVMKKNGGGRIINVASVCATHAWPGFSVYSAAKAGLILFSRCLCKDFAPYNITSSTFIPGAAPTNFRKAAGMESGAREGFPEVADYARGLVAMVDLPAEAMIEDLTFWASKQVQNDMNPF